jgi:3-phytase
MNTVFKVILLMFICNGMVWAQPSVTIKAKALTSSTGNDVDDCAIWVHPTDPSKSLAIINDKGPLTGTGGLYVYTLDGTLLQKVSVHYPQNPDIRYNVVFGSDTMDVLVCVDREAANKNYNKLRVFKIDPSRAEDKSGFLTEITTSAGIPSGQSNPYGHSLYKRPSDGALFSIVSSNSKTDFTQIKLESDSTGKVKGDVVRTWGATDITGDMCEGICCDDELGFIYICDENSAVLKYSADPDKNDDKLVNAFAKGDGIESDREGINIYRCNDRTGYILLSSQGNNQIKVYDRGTNEFLGTIKPEEMKDCDGLDITAVPLGPNYPHGMAAFHLGSTVGAQFGFYDWADIATGLGLATPCDAERPGVTPVTITKQKKTLSTDSQRSQKLSYFRNRILLKNIPDVKGLVTITLYDLRGNKVGIPVTNVVDNSEIDMSFTLGMVHPGTYLLKCSSNSGTYTGKLLMAKR